MGILDRLRANGNGDRAVLEREIREATARADDAEAEMQRYDASFGIEVERMRESLGMLELQLDEAGWQRISANASDEFSRGGLDKIVEQARLAFLKNPLIRRSVVVQAYYVFGQGVSVAARDEIVNEVVSAFWGGDPTLAFHERHGNRDELSGHAALEANEQALQYDGNLFFALFVEPTTGRVRVRLIPIDEVREIVTNPDDRGDRWYYERRWSTSGLNLATGGIDPVVENVAYYPDWRIFWAGEDGSTKRTKIGDHEVRKNVAIYHVRAGGLRHMRFGVPDVYAALDWARAYKSFLENYSSLVASLSRFAWRLATTKNRMEGAKRKLASTMASGNPNETNPPPTAGATFIGDEQSSLEAIPKTGAVISAEAGRPLRTMVAAGTDIPDTILAGDPDMGNLATAKTLDRPTELAMRSRQMLWQETIRDLCAFAIEADLRATNGKLPKNGTGEDVRLGRTTDPKTKKERDGDPTVDVSFPPVLETDRAEVIESIVKAYTLDGDPPAGTLPPEFVSKLLLVAFEAENVDELVEELFAVADPEDAPADDDERAELVAAMRNLHTALRFAVTTREQGSADAIAGGAVMVGWFLPLDQATALAIENGEPPAELHMTLAFVGTADEIGPEKIAELKSAVAAFAETNPVLRGQTSGVGRFQLPDQDAIWASADVPGLDSFRARLVHALNAAGVGVRNEHGFTPHVTLAYVPAGSPAPITTVPVLDLTIDRLYVAVGGERSSYALSWEPVGDPAGAPA